MFLYGKVIPASLAFWILRCGFRIPECGRITFHAAIVITGKFNCTCTRHKISGLTQPEFPNLHRRGFVEVF